MKTHTIILKVPDGVTLDELRRAYQSVPSVDCLWVSDNFSKEDRAKIRRVYPAVIIATKIGVETYLRNTPLKPIVGDIRRQV